MGTKSLRDLLRDELAEAYDADRQILAAWPKLKDAAQAASLKKLCQEGVDYTQRRIERLEAAFKELKLPPAGKPSQAMKTLVARAQVAVAADLPQPAKDAALNGEIQRLSHYGYANYSALLGYAEALREMAVVDLLKPSLEEKKEAVQEEAAMAHLELNPRAVASG